MISLANITGISDNPPSWIPSKTLFSNPFLWRLRLSISRRLSRKHTNDDVWYGSMGKEALDSPSMARDLLIKYGAPSPFNPFAESEPEHWDWHPGGYLGTLLDRILDATALLDPEHPPEPPAIDSWVEDPLDESPAIRPSSRSTMPFPDSDDINRAVQRRETAMAIFQLMLAFNVDVSGVLMKASLDDVQHASCESYLHGWGETVGADSAMMLTVMVKNNLVPTFFSVGLLMLRKMIEKNRKNPERNQTITDEEESGPKAPPLNIDGWRDRKRVEDDEPPETSNL